MRNQTRRLKAEINVVPYIDVMLVLLVIFMVTAPLSRTHNIDLPNADRATQIPSNYISLTLNADKTASIFVQQVGKKYSQKRQGLNTQQVKRRLSELHAEFPELPLLIAADKNLIYQEVVTVMNDAKKMGIPRIGLATQ